MKRNTNSVILMPFWQMIESKAKILAFVVLAGVPSAGLAQDSITLINPSFEWGYNASGNISHYWTNISAPSSYVPFGWKPSENNIGINDTTGPSWDNGASVDGAYVGFIQGKNSFTGTIAQTNSGFQVGQNYWIQFFANAKDPVNISGAATTPDVAVVETASTSGSTALISGLNIPVSGGPIGTGNPFTFVNVSFKAAATNGVLTILKSSHVSTSKSHLFLDGFSIIRRTTNDIVVANPSFEASSTNQTSPGYMTAVAGWTPYGGGAMGINQQGGAFADNGAVPDGGNVLLLQGASGVSQNLHGLVAGTTNRLTLYLNGRAYDPANGFTNLALVTIDGQLAYNGPVAPSGPAGSLSPYLFVSFDFVASAADVTVSIENQASDGSALLADNVRVFALVPEAPAVTAQPVGGTRYVGGAITIAASVYGYPEPQLQWKHDGNAIAGATSHTLVLTNLQVTNAGSYVLYATNSAGFTNTVAATLNVLVPSGYASVVLASSPMGYWRFSDGGGTNAYDYIGVNNGLDALGQPLQAGPRPPAFAGFESTNSAPFMNGTNQGYATTSPLLSGLSEFTILGWFKIDPSQYPFTGSAHPEGRASLFGQRLKAELAFYQGTNLYFYGDGMSTIFVTNGFTPGAWHFVAAVSNPGSNTTTLYLDGAVVGSDLACSGASQPSLFSIGKNVSFAPENAFFPGNIDEVAVFDHALSASAVEGIYRAGTGFGLSISPQLGGFQIVWPVGHLESATNVSGPWQSEPGAVSPLSATPAGAMKFYRAVLP